MLKNVLRPIDPQSTTQLSDFIKIKYVGELENKDNKVKEVRIHPDYWEEDTEGDDTSPIRNPYNLALIRMDQVRNNFQIKQKLFFISPGYL